MTSTIGGGSVNDSYNTYVIDKVVNVTLIDNDGNVIYDPNHVKDDKKSNRNLFFDHSVDCDCGCGDCFAKSDDESEILLNENGEVIEPEPYNPFYEDDDTDKNLLVCKNETKYKKLGVEKKRGTPGVIKITCKYGHRESNMRDGMCTCLDCWPPEDWPSDSDDSIYNESSDDNLDVKIETEAKSETSEVKIESVSKNPLSGDLTRYSFFPIKYPKLIEYYHKQKSVFWIAQEIPLAGDRNDWDKLDNDTKSYITFILSLFSQLDGIVNENLVENFKKDTDEYKECRMFYAIQEAVECTHNEAYSLFIKAYIRDPEEQIRSLNAIHNYPEIAAIAKWAFEWMKPDRPFLERLIAFACIEGIIFSSAFAGIYWIKRKNILGGLTKANEWIARDENYHTEFPVALYHTITLGQMTIHDQTLPALPEGRVHEIISSAVDVTEKFTRNAMRNELVMLNSDDMVGYVKCTADHLSKSLGYNPIYDIDNPLTWMVVISLPNKTNFFEGIVTEYSRQNGQDEDDYKFDLDTPC